MKNTCILKRIGKIALIVLASLLAAWLLIQLVTTLIFFEFFRKSDKEFRIPGQSDGLVSQGFTYLPDQQVYLQCGYMADGVSASRIYVIPKAEPKKNYYIELKNADGTPYTGHTGGIAVSGNFMWLANDGEGDDNCVWVISIYDFFRLEAGESYTLKNSFQPETRAAYCYAEGNVLWVGEFHRPVDYPTKETHAFTVADDVEHRALIACYQMDHSNTETGLASLTPIRLVSVPDHVQGFARDEYGHFVLSTSYGLSKSHLLFYDDITVNAPDATLDVNGTSVPVWFLDADVQHDDLVCPPMSEEIVIQDGRLFYLTESASQKYIFGNLIRGRHVYSLPIEH